MRWTTSWWSTVVDKWYDDVRSDSHLWGPGEVREGMMWVHWPWHWQYQFQSNSIQFNLKEIELTLKSRWGLDRVWWECIDPGTSCIFPAALRPKIVTGVIIRWQWNMVWRIRLGWSMKIKVWWECIDPGASCILPPALRPKIVTGVIIRWQWNKMWSTTFRWGMKIIKVWWECIYPGASCILPPAPRLSSNQKILTGVIIR